MNKHIYYIVLSVFTNNFILFPNKKLNNIKNNVVTHHEWIQPTQNHTVNHPHTHYTLTIHRSQLLLRLIIFFTVISLDSTLSPQKKSRKSGTPPPTPATGLVRIYKNTSFAFFF